jgi:two-component system, NtrC family, sensor kinase
VAEQIAWVKGKSHRIGLRLSLNEDLRSLMRFSTVYGFHRQNGKWTEWLGQNATMLAELLDYNKVTGESDQDLRESAMLCAPLATRDGVLGVLKVSARHPSSFGSYEVNLLQRFVPLAAVAIQNSQRTFTLETKMLEAEKKHAVANLARGVSHDINNALGAVLPLVQQILADIESNRLDSEILSQDLQQIEQSLQTCRRIFGGMLSLARGATQGTSHADVRRALDGTLAIVRDGLERQRIRLDIQLMDLVPHVRMVQGDLSIKSDRAGEKLKITIRDTGCGIPPEDMSRIQEPFFTTKHNGNGLGLSICRSIVWNAGGEMKIESQPGAGTDISVLVPIVDDKTT